jgi:hypothetical protein
MIDPLAIWKSEFAKLPLDPTGAAGALNLAKYINARVSNKLGMSPKVAAVDAPAKAVFTWQPSVFVASLLGLTFSPVAAVGALKMSSAWASATQASTFIVAPGAVISPPPPPSTGASSVITLSIVEPPSIVKSQQALFKGLLSAGQAATALDSEIPKLLYEAFLGLTFAVSGLDTTPTPAGPLPITLVGVPAE